MSDTLDFVTDKQEHFARNLVNGQTLTEAYKNAGYSSDPANAKQALESENVQRAIHKLRQPGQWGGKQRLIAASADAVNLLLDVINDNLKEDVPLDKKIECSTDLLDRIGMKEASQEEVNIGVGLDEDQGEVDQILFEMREKEENYGDK